MTNFKKIERATKLFMELKELDAAIIKIEQFAMQAANDESLLNLSMEIITENKQNENLEAQKNAAKNEISLMFQSYFMINPMGTTSASQQHKELFTHEATNKEALLIFGIILQSKIARREYLLNKIEELSK